MVLYLKYIALNSTKEWIRNQSKGGNNMSVIWKVVFFSFPSIEEGLSSRIVNG